MRELFKKKIKELGYPSKVFSLHSLMQEVLQLLLMQECQHLFKRHGKWKLDNAKDGYIEDSMHGELSVTWHLGI